MKAKKGKTVTLKEQAVFMLVGFSFQQVEAAKLRYQLDRKYRQYRKKGKSKEESEKLLKEEFGDYKKTTIACSFGIANKGVFPTQLAAQRFIERNHRSIHEGGYYVYYLIEKRPFGFDHIAHDPDAEKWFKGRSTGKSWGSYKYYPCNKPRFYIGTCFFSG